MDPNLKNNTLPKVSMTMHISRRMRILLFDNEVMQCNETPLLHFSCDVLWLINEHSYYIVGFIYTPFVETKSAISAIVSCMLNILKQIMTNSLILAMAH